MLDRSSLVAVWRVVERAPGRWFCEVMPSVWSGRYEGRPVALVGELAECLGLALHEAAQCGQVAVCVWPESGRAYSVQVSGVVPDAMPGALRAEVV